MPIDQDIHRHLLTEFGPCDTPANAQATLLAASNALIAQGGGVIVIPDSISPEFVLRNAVQNAGKQAMPGVLIEDYRNGGMRLVVPPEGFSNLNADVTGGLMLERDLDHDIFSQAGGSALAISNRTRGGVNSVSDVLLDFVAIPPIGKLSEGRFYVKSLRGLCVGNWLFIKEDPLRIKSLGVDAVGYYFIAVSQKTYKTGDRYFHKNWFSAIEIADTHNCDDQSGSLSITRSTYGSGDSFGIQTTMQYSGDIMSAGGDEGGVAYSAFIYHDIDLFWGEVESWNARTFELVYKLPHAAVDAVPPTPSDPGKPAIPPVLCENFWKLGTSRPIINMDEKSWTTSGMVFIPLGSAFTDEKNFKSDLATVIGYAGLQWDDSVIGKFITIDEETEYYKPGEDLKYMKLPNTHIFRRWFRITSRQQREQDKLWSLGIETVWWGSYYDGKPVLFRESNYSSGVNAIKPLKYIIAPGSWVTDVRNALGPRKYYVDASPAGRTIRLAPFPNAKDAFKPGDAIAQPAGPTPWTPISFRSRNFNLFPPLIPGSCFVADNDGPTILKAGLSVVNGPYAQGTTLDQIMGEQKDQVPPFGYGVEIAACTEYAVAITGPVLYTAIFLDQRDENKKIIQWLGVKPNPDQNDKEHPLVPAGANIYLDNNGNLTFETSDAINLSLKSTYNQAGLSASPIPAKNLRGINVPVLPVGVTTNFPIQFPANLTEDNENYAIVVTCNWSTMTRVWNKTKAGFSVDFSQDAPVGGTLDWVLIR